jgi:hypothetical protein
VLLAEDHVLLGTVERPPRPCSIPGVASNLSPA